MKYLMIFEDGSFGVVNSIKDEDFESVEIGVLDIIRSYEDTFEFYYGEEWHTIDEYEREEK